MQHQIEHTRAIHDDHLRAAEAHRLASMLPPRPSIWTRLAGHLSPPRDRGAATRRPGDEHGAVGVAATSTHDL